MGACYHRGDFAKYYRENMRQLGLPAPTSLFGNYLLAAATVRRMLAPLKTLGKDVTVDEIIGATGELEKLDVVGGLGASYYVGAAIGSMATAGGRSLACGTEISDLFVFMILNPDFKFPDYPLFYAKYPEILDRTRPNRWLFRVKALHAARRSA